MVLTLEDMNFFIERDPATREVHFSLPGGKRIVSISDHLLLEMGDYWIYYVSQDILRNLLAIKSGIKKAAESRPETSGVKARVLDTAQYLEVLKKLY